MAYIFEWQSLKILGLNCMLNTSPPFIDNDAVARKLRLLAQRACGEVPPPHRKMILARYTTGAGIQIRNRL